jgi:hypothetical protein
VSLRFKPKPRGEIAYSRYLTTLAARPQIEEERLNFRVVLYGSNLASTVGSPKFSAIERALISIPSVKGKMGVFIGILIAGATLSKGSRGEARLQFKQKYREFEYFYSVFFQLSHYCRQGPRAINHGGIIPKKVHYSLRFTTISLPCITSLYSLFYDENGRKVISNNLVFLLSEEALAH